MTAPRPPDPVKLFVGVLYSDAALLSKAKARLIEAWGSVDFESEPIPFDITDYYNAEMGSGIARVLWSFERLIRPDELVRAKLFSNEIEAALAIDGKRKVNIDPGYLDHYKVVLASAKFGGQKIYLSEGIYGDIVLWYEKGKFKPFIWGFPDFKSGRYDASLLEIRRRYHTQVLGEKN
jgi:hypothetical protein